MDFIKLERLEGLSKKQEDSKKSSSKQKKAKVMTIDTSQYKACYPGFNQLRKTLYAALPIPPQVIPILASQPQVNAYEQAFLQPHNVIENMTIRELLEPFSLARNYVEKEKFGKILFLKKYLTKLTNNNLVN